MQPHFTIRTAREDDRPALVMLMELLQDTECKLHPNRSPGAEIGDGHLAYLEARVREQHGQIYVAEGEEGLIGLLVCFVEKLDAGDLHVRDAEREYGYISDLCVAAAMRKRGVAAALMQAAEQHFLSLNLPVVRVGSLFNNAPASTFYQKAGYQPYEILYEKRLNN